MHKHKIIVSYGADNANANFGSNHSISMNFVANTKENIKINLYGCIYAIYINKANCSLHILYNMFTHSAKLCAELINIFEDTEMEWVELFRYVNTIFLSLSPAVMRVINVWVALKSHFDKQ